MDWADFDDDAAVQVVSDAPGDDEIVQVADEAVAGWLEGLVDDVADPDVSEDPAGWLAALEGVEDDDFVYDADDRDEADEDVDDADDDDVAEDADEVDVAEQKSWVVDRLLALRDDIAPADDRDEFLAEFLSTLQAHAEHGTPYSQCRQAGECGLGDRFGLDLGDDTVRADCSGLIVGSALQAGLWTDPAAWWTGGMIDQWEHIEVALEDRRAGDVVLNMTHAGVVTESGVVHASGSRGVVVDPWEGSWFGEQDDLRVYRLADLVDAGEGAESDSEMILSLIREAESNDDYYAIVHVGADTWQDALNAVGVEGPVTALSVGQIRDVQEAWLDLQERAGVPVRSTAVGAYQIISGTLQMLIDRGVVSERDRFDDATQDSLAFALLESRGWQAFVAGDLSATDLARNLSMEWAGLPDPATGRSYYAGDGVNASTVPVDAVLDALDGD